MRSLPILHRLLFLLALHTPQAQGAPVKTPGTQQCYVLSLIREIINELDKLHVASEDFLNSNEKRRLMKTSLWRPNLEKFLTFATNSLGEDSKITKNLKEIQPILPTTMTTEEPILIEKDNLGDFWVKLKEYLSAIRDSLNCKNTQRPNV
ncbi:interleukin-3-like [Delphinapterus leucas]|uniref:Interleukin-3 n=1 Tax=Delphinapterus leucas TaxID=9749 RepID=A0A7F8KD05_DELLE|nr:interleukin-3-like [Delphinapterus leucas]